MTETVSAPSSPPPSSPSSAAGRRRWWRWLVVALVLCLLYVLYGGRLGGVSAPAEARGEFQQLRYPSALGSARVRRLGASFERVQVGGFGEAKKRGPRAAIQALWKMTRDGGLLFEVRGLASDAERDYLLKQKPYACEAPGASELLDTVAGIELRRAKRMALFGWLPTPVSLCGSRVQGGVLTHVSGFATEGTWVRERPQLLAMLRDWQVKREQVPTAAHGCRLHTGHSPPLYVQFKSEELAARGVVDKDSVHWLDLPYRSDDSLGRFSPEKLDQVSAECASAQASFAEHTARGESPDNVAAQDAHHAFMARCEPLFATLRFLGAEKLEPELLPRPLSGWSMQLDPAEYAPAICLPVQGE